MTREKSLVDFNDQSASVEPTTTPAPGARVLYRRTNFLVLAPASQPHPPDPPLAQDDGSAIPPHSGSHPGFRFLPPT